MTARGPTDGPFQWTPQVVGHECLLADVSASGDLSNIDPAGGLPAATGPIPHWRLVPFDNNIAQRNVAPVAGAGGASGLAASFSERAFTARNPYDHPARLELRAWLPKFLEERGWHLMFTNPGGSSFTLGPRGERKVVLLLRRGRELAANDVPSEDSDLTIHTIIDGVTIGGMSYRVDPRLAKPAVELDPGRRTDDCADGAARLLDCLNLPSDVVKRVRVRRITVDIDLQDDC